MAFDKDAESLLPMGFSDREVRQGFIRKVFGILGLQLVITTVIGGLIYYPKTGLQDFAQKNPGILYLLMILTFVLIIVISCVDQARRSFPLNYILLFSFTFVEAALVGFIAASYTLPSVILAAGITTVMVISLSIFAFQTKYDFTTSIGFLFAGVIALVGVGFVSIFFPGITTGIFGTIIAGFGAFLFCCYLVVDIQMMMGGKKYSISPDEFVFAALNLYLDIIQIFLYILQLFGERR